MRAAGGASWQPRSNWSPLPKRIDYQGVWRTPAAESHDYPGLCVHDGRVSGSITADCTRLPLWAFIWNALVEGWPAVEHNWSPSKYGWDAERLGSFLSNLLEQRGEMARLICVLADVERRDGVTSKRHDHAWWESKTQRRRVIAQLKRCLAALEAEELLG